MSKSLIDSIRAAVEREPENVELRLHLAELELEAGECSSALAHAQGVLAADPTNEAALQCAIGAAEESGEKKLAAGYERLLAGLTGAEPTRLSVARAADPSVESEQGDEPAFELIDGSARFAPEADAAQRITLDDVGGMEEIKRRLKISFLAPMQNEDLRKMYNKSLRGGLLLYGPPGCGKTFIARALAGELNARFETIGLPDVLSMWLGESESKLHEIFESARRSTPMVLFLDELDALGHKRSNLTGHAGRNVINVLLSEMDGVQSSNDGLFILAATNHPWDVDGALRRPGRFDRMELVLPPDEKARVSILEYHLRELPVDPEVRPDRIASWTKEFSGADLALLCQSSAELAMERAFDSQKRELIGTKDFKRALKEIKPSTRGWFETAKHYAMFANESGLYDDLQDYIRRKRY